MRYKCGLVTFVEFGQIEGDALKTRTIAAGISIFLGLWAFIIDIQYIYRQITTDHSYIIKIIFFSILTLALMIEGVINFLGTK